MLIDGAARRNLVDAIRARDVRRIVYFHADHFEPWKPFPGRVAISPRNCDDLVNFADRVQRIDYARRLTLFYKAHVTQTMDLNQSGVRKAVPADIFGFVDRPAAQHELACGGMRHLVGTTKHELQVHIHHENFTSNESHKDPRLAAYFADPEHASHDGERLDLAIEYWLETIKVETGLALDRWFFVHGLWALNGSDPKVCKIFDEIQILMKRGCLGDFTFPAGRKAVDPQLEEPFFIQPINAQRCYDLPETQPTPAYGHDGAGQFFIWNSKIKHTGSSLDYYAPWLRKKLETIEPFALEIVNRSHVADGTLWFKTHAHSLHQNYSEETRIPIFPHEHPHIQALIGSVLDAGAKAGAEISFLTASEVYEAFRRGAVEKVAQCSSEGASASANGGAQAAENHSIAQGACPGGIAEPAPSRDIAKRVCDGPIDVDIVNAAVVSAVRRQIAEFGEAASGAGSYYQVRADRGTILMRYEVALVGYLLSETDRPAQVFEIGSGVGALPMLLAANGLRSVGIEADRRRHQMAHKALAALALEKPDMADRCQLVCGRFPPGAGEMDTSEATAITTNIITTLSADDTDAFIAGLAWFRRVIVDVSRFLVARNNADEQAKLVKRLASANLGRAKLIADFGGEGVYWMFRRL